MDSLPSICSPNPEFRTEPTVDVDMVAKKPQTNVAINLRQCLEFFRRDTVLWGQRAKDRQLVFPGRNKNDVGGHRFWKSVVHQLELPRFMRAKRHVSSAQSRRQNICRSSSSHVPQLRRRQSDKR